MSAAGLPDGARIILASHNAKKLAELQRILVTAVPDLETEQVISAAGVDLPDVVEDAVTFQGNALLKARAAAGATGLLAVADDSGLAVDVLGGARSEEHTSELQSRGQLVCRLLL